MNKILIIVHFTLIAFVFAINEDDLAWIEWKQKYGKKAEFSNDKKELKAYSNFKNNEQKVKIHNANPKRSYDMELNEFAIYDEQTFQKKYCGLRLPKRLHLGQPLLSTTSYSGPLGNYTTSNLPKSVNYTKYYQPIQDQRGCGSCWAFSVASALGLKFNRKKFNLEC
jgi:C1A family cysteine protease